MRKATGDGSLVEPMPVTIFGIGLVLLKDTSSSFWPSSLLLVETYVYTSGRALHALRISENHWTHNGQTGHDDAVIG